MAITAPTGEQLRFVSSKTGEHVLDTYLEAAEIGNRQLHDLLDDMFDTSTGVFRSDNFQFRYDTSTDKIQVRVGQFANSNTSWTDVTTFFKITGTFSASTTYNNFDLLTLSNKDVYIVHGLSSGTTFADEAAVIASSNTSKIVDVSEAKDWAMKTDGQVASTDYSSKAWAIGGTGVTNTASKGAAKEWATKTGGTVDGTSYSAKYWATSTNVTTVAGGISNINTVAGSISNVNTTAASISDVNTTAGSISNVNTVAAELGSGQDVTVVAANISNVTTVAGISSNVTTVAGISANVTTVAGISANVTTVAGNNIDVSTVASNVADIQTVADEIDNNKLQTVANNINAVVTAADDLNEATSEIDTVATNIANVNAVGTNIANVNTLAGISSAVTTAATNTTAFNNLYLGAQSSAPTQDPDGSALDVGDLYFDTTSNTMKVRAASGWVNASSTVNGTANRFTFTATANQTTFTGADANNNTLAYDSGFMDVYMNGVKLAPADVTASNGTSVVITAAAAGDTLEMIAYGTFELLNVEINDLTDVNTTGLANNDVLVYNSSNSRFEPSTKLGTIETNADVTDATNVAAAGAAMTSGATFTGTLTSSGDLIVNSDGSHASGAIQINNSSTSTYGKAIEAYSSGISDGKYHQIMLGKEGATNNTGTINFKYNSDGSNTNYISFGLWGNDEVVTATGAGNVGISNQAPAYTLDVAGTTSADQYLIGAIAKDISDTAVDVFVYDTSKDSDGGAWRKRTQATSWYNEAASATRGSRKEFPAVAVIVATSSGVTIYDGDDPDLPMWMVFETNSSDMLSSGILSLTMLNGVLAVGRNTPLHVISFVSDGHTSYSPTSRNSYLGAIGQRNSGLGFSANLGTPYAVANVGNDVAMTVLPNAPIDAATGLPVPTIAVATDGGLCAIKDDGTVTGVLGNIGEKIYSVDFVKDGTGDIWYGSTYEHLKRITLDNETKNWWTSFDSGSASPYSGWYASVSGFGRDPHKVVTLDANTAAAVPQLSEGFGLHRFNGTQGSGSDRFKGSPSVAYVSKDFNSGHMVGDIKLATLSDTSTTNVTGAELVTNGTFDSDISGWSAGGNATLSLSSNQLSVAYNSVNYAYAYQAITTVVGKVYTATALIDVVTGTKGRLAFSASAAGNIDLGYVDTAGTASETVSVTFTATSTTTYLSIINLSPTGSLLTDNVSVRLAEADRSVNGNGLQVFGTITKSAVATGADLVAYSGFSTSNYLQQPYNSDLDFGTDDFCYIWWANIPTTAFQTHFTREHHNGSSFVGASIEVFSDNNTNKLKIFMSDDGYGSYDAWVSSSTISGMQCFAVVRQGNVIHTYINGLLDNTHTISAPAGSMDNSDATLSVGVQRNNMSPNTTGSIALLRASATAPSPEQIKKIYEDEKVLFQENAQATLYGSSDAVTALAYDDSTDLLHVGTSAGRSVFQGLRRVDNTTDAVGAAISASNGLVAED